MSMILINCAAADDTAEDARFGELRWRRFGVLAQFPVRLSSLPRTARRRSLKVYARMQSSSEIFSCGSWPYDTVDVKN